MMSHKSKHLGRERGNSKSGEAAHGSPVSEQEWPTAHAGGWRHPALFPERYFRWRAGEITRLEAFCDVVFGFALTLLVVSLEVPHNYGELLAAMRGFVPFAIYFAQLAMIWRAHYRFSRRYGLEDDSTLFLNMLLLFVVLFYVYPLKFVWTLLFSEIMGASSDGFGIHEASVVMRVYAVGWIAVFALMSLLYVHAYKLRRELGLNAAEVMETRMSLQENVLMALIGVVSLLVAFKNATWAGWTYGVIGPALAIHGAIFGKRVRLLAEGEEHRK